MVTTNKGLSGEREIQVGDYLLLGLVRAENERSIICRVCEIGVNGHAWEAMHCFYLGTGGWPATGTRVWWGPDDRSWSSVTNLGPLEIGEDEPVIAVELSGEDQTGSAVLPTDV